jgi:hypothetical protein
MQATSHTHVDFDIPLRSYLGLDIGHFVARNKHSSFVISIFEYLYKHNESLDPMFYVFVLDDEYYKSCS